MIDNRIEAPTIHINGTGRDTLEQEYRAAGDALDAAMGALQRCTLHMRDFYILPDGEARFRKAVAEHQDRIARIRSVYDEITAMHEKIIFQDILKIGVDNRSYL